MLRDILFFIDTRTGTDGAGDSGTLDMGSRSSLHTGLHMSEDEHWEMNYHEAAIYLEVSFMHSYLASEFDAMSFELHSMFIYLCNNLLEH